MSNGFALDISHILVYCSFSDDVWERWCKETAYTVRENLDTTWEIPALTEIVRKLFSNFETDSFLVLTENLDVNAVQSQVASVIDKLVLQYFSQQKIEKDTRVDWWPEDVWEDYVNRILPEDGYTVLKNTGFEVTFITTPTFTDFYKGNCINTITNCIVDVNVPSVK